MKDFSLEDGNEQKERKSAYLIDVESGAEMVRLLDLDRLATQSMGGLLPREVSIASDAHILDIACGPGGWAQRAAFEYPAAQIVGIDISKRMTDYAQQLAKVQNLDNVSFAVGDASKALQFPDQTFDMINMRLAFGFMSPSQWPTFLQEAKRITKPGGTICLTEAEGFGISTSDALERLNQMTIQGLHVAKRTYHVLGSAVGITPMLRRFLREAGYQNVQTRANGLDFSMGTKAHSLTCQNILVALQLLKGYFVQVALATSDEFDQLLYQAEMEMQESNFSAICYGLSAWGNTPLSSQEQ